MLTYQEAFNRLTEAYIHGEVNPYRPTMCFCGNLENKTQEWAFERDNAKYNMGFPSKSHLNYTGMGYAIMETAFMKPIGAYLTNAFPNVVKYGWVDKYNASTDINTDYENALFKGFTDALEVLKQIHISRGEKVDDLVFEKRTAIPA